MGTSNFYTKNASKTFAVCMNEEVKYSECSECREKAFEYDEEYLPIGTTDCPLCEEKDCITHGEESRCLETDEYDNDVDYFRETLAENKKLYSYDDSTDNNRNFSGTSLGYFGMVKTYGDITMEVRVQAMVRAGYCEGANLDYNDVEVYANGSEIDVNDVAKDVVDYVTSDFSAGALKQNANYAAKWVEKSKCKIISDLEKVFTKVSMPLTVVARFSNGETMYAKA